MEGERIPELITSPLRLIILKFLLSQFSLQLMKSTFSETKEFITKLLWVQTFFADLIGCTSDLPLLSTDVSL